MTMQRETRIFKLDDSADPGLARVEVLSSGRMAGTWKVRIVKILKPSFAACRVGETRLVAARLLSPDEGEKGEGAS